MGVTQDLIFYVNFQDILMTLSCQQIVYKQSKNIFIGLSNIYRMIILCKLESYKLFLNGLAIQLLEKNHVENIKIQLKLLIIGIGTKVKGGSKGNIQFNHNNITIGLCIVHIILDSLIKNLYFHVMHFRSQSA